MMRVSRKICFIPGCQTTESDGKIMITVPDREPRRTQWLGVANRKAMQSTRLYCCEDHFELEDDAENWMKFKTFADTKILLKPHVVPHQLLHPPTPRKRRLSSQLTDSTKKRRKENTSAFKSSQKDPVREITIQGSPFSVRECEGVTFPSSGSSSGLNVPQRKPNRRKQLVLPRTDPDFESQCAQSTPGMQPLEVTEVLFISPSPALCTSTSDQQEVPRERTPISSPLAIPFSSSPQQGGSQEVPRERTPISSPLAIPFSSSPQQGGSPRLTLNSPSLPDVHAGHSTRNRELTLSPIPSRLLQLRTGSPPSSISSSGSYKPSVSSSSDEAYETMKMKAHCWPFQQHLLKTRSQFYLGLTKQHFILIQTCSTTARMLSRDVMIVFKKIRTDDEHSRLADDFGLSISTISTAFSVGLAKLSALLKHFIFWPTKQSVLLKLPMQFRYEFNQVQSIIDGFEIEIEKPQNPIHQSLTWSEYKGCNTIKYLISCTPQGFINFISEGFGGRTSDAATVEQSEYIQELPNDSTVLADRGFKQIERLLAPKNCKLVRPPSVRTGERLPPDQVKQSKRISAVRIHVERVIGRIREFKFCRPHARIDHNLIHLLDHAVVIACALVNLQDPLIR